MSHSVPRVVLTFNISNTGKTYVFRTLMAIEIIWYIQFCHYQIMILSVLEILKVKTTLGTVTVVNIIDYPMFA